MLPQRNTRASIAIGAGLLLIVAGVTLAFSEALADSKPGTILGGALSSVVFFLVFTLLGNVAKTMGRDTAGWPEGSYPGTSSAGSHARSPARRSRRPLAQ